MWGGREFSQAVLAFAAGVFVCVFAIVLLSADRLPQWCGSDEGRCLREWISASSGWAAAAGAAFTIFVLWKTLEHMRQSSEQQLRAYLHVSDAEIRTNPDWTKKVVIKITNYGQTPASEVEIYWSMVLNARGSRRASPTSVMNITTVPPGHSDLLGIHFPLEIDLQATGNPEVKGLTLDVELRYKDAFGRSTAFPTRYISSETSGLTDGPMIAKTVKPST